MFGTPAIAQDRSGQLLAGFGVADIELPAGVPVAGYGDIARRNIPFRWSSDSRYAFFFKPSTGLHDPIQARAMVLRRGSEPLVFVRVDLVAVSAAMESALRERLADLQIPTDHLSLSATHTHSGPGTFADSFGFAVIAIDYYRREIFDRIVAACEQAVRAAMAAAVPARLFSVSFAVDKIRFNRRNRTAPVDDNANLLLARTDDSRWLGGIINFAIHPTALPPANLQLSADIPGAIERQLAARLRSLNGSPAPVTVLFINGALGDVAPVLRNFDGIERTGEIVARQAEQSLSTADEVVPRWTVATAALDLGDPSVALGNCLNPGWSTSLLSGMHVPLGSLLSGNTSLRLLHLGDIAMMTWPGEPTSALGAQLKQAAAQAGARQSWVLGLTGDYKYYFTTPEEFEHRGYESCFSVFGRDAGARIVAAYRELLSRPAIGAAPRPAGAD